MGCIRDATLPVGETGGSKVKGARRGGGSPGLHNPGLDPGAEGRGYPAVRRSEPLTARGAAPLSSFCERGRYRMAETPWGFGDPCESRGNSTRPAACGGFARDGFGKDQMAVRQGRGGGFWPVSDVQPPRGARQASSLA